LPAAIRRSRERHVSAIAIVVSADEINRRAARELDRRSQRVDAGGLRVLGVMSVSGSRL
jgi:hypothetical protein